MTKKHSEFSNENVVDADMVDVSPEAGPSRSSSRTVLIAAGLVIVALAGGLWYQHTQSVKNIRILEQAADRASQNAASALSTVQLLDTQVKDQAQRIVRLDNSLRDSRAQLDTLVQAFQTLTDSGSDLVLINDVDQLVTIAQQQLQLGGNVANAIVALEAAQAQLARANRPSLASLLQTINGDLDRLRAVATVDVVKLTSQLDKLSLMVSQAPLRVPDIASPEPVNPPPEFDGFSVPSAPDTVSGAADTPWWKSALDTTVAWSSSAWGSIRQDLGEFITIRRVDDSAAMLMSPDQAARFRENLRLRLMTAQLALMMRQPTIWSAEMSAVVSGIEARFDERSQESRQALALARQLFDTQIDTSLPSLTNSLKAIEMVREENARASSGSGSVPVAITAGSAAPVASPAQPTVAPAQASVTPSAQAVAQTPAPMSATPAVAPVQPAVTPSATSVPSASPASAQSVAPVVSAPSAPPAAAQSVVPAPAEPSVSAASPSIPVTQGQSPATVSPGTESAVPVKNQE